MPKGLPDKIFSDPVHALSFIQKVAEEEYQPVCPDCLAKRIRRIQNPTLRFECSSCRRKFPLFEERWLNYLSVPPSKILSALWEFSDPSDSTEKGNSQIGDETKKRMLLVTGAALLHKTPVSSNELGGILESRHAEKHLRAILSVLRSDSRRGISDLGPSSSAVGYSEESSGLDPDDDGDFLALVWPNDPKFKFTHRYRNVAIGTHPQWDLVFKASTGIDEKLKVIQPREDDISLCLRELLTVLKLHRVTPLTFPVYFLLQQNLWNSKRKRRQAFQHLIKVAVSPLPEALNAKLSE